MHSRVSFTRILIPGLFVFVILACQSGTKSEDSGGNLNIPGKNKKLSVPTETKQLLQADAEIRGELSGSLGLSRKFSSTKADCWYFTDLNVAFSMSQDIDLAGLKAMSSLKVRNVLYNKCVRNYNIACNQNDRSNLGKLLSKLEPVLKDGVTDKELETELKEIEAYLPKEACMEAVSPIEIEFEKTIKIDGVYIFNNQETTWSWPTKDLIPDVLVEDLEQIDPVFMSRLKSSKEWWVNNHVGQSYDKWGKTWSETRFPDWAEDYNIKGVCNIIIDAHLLQAASNANGSLNPEHMKKMAEESTRSKLIERCNNKFSRMCVDNSSFFAYEGIKNFVDRIEKNMDLDEVDDALVELNAAVHYNLTTGTSSLSVSKDCEKHVTGLAGNIYTVYGQRKKAPEYGKARIE